MRAGDATAHARRTSKVTPARPTRRSRRCAPHLAHASTLACVRCVAWRTDGRRLAGMRRSAAAFTVPAAVGCGPFRAAPLPRARLLSLQVDVQASHLRAVAGCRCSRQQVATAHPKCNMQHATAHPNATCNMQQRTAASTYGVTYGARHAMRSRWRPVGKLCNSARVGSRRLGCFGRLAFQGRTGPGRGSDDDALCVLPHAAACFRCRTYGTALRDSPCLGAAAARHATPRVIACLAWQQRWLLRSVAARVRANRWLVGAELLFTLRPIVYLSAVWRIAAPRTQRPAGWHPVPLGTLSVAHAHARTADALTCGRTRAQLAPVARLAHARLSRAQPRVRPNLNPSHSTRSTRSDSTAPLAHPVRPPPTAARCRLRFRVLDYAHTAARVGAGAGAGTGPCAATG
jgi:hypothetical protein